MGAATQPDPQQLLGYLQGQPGCTVDSKIRPVKSELHGFGLQCTTQVRKGEVLACIPARATWTALVAKVTPTLGPLLREVPDLSDDDAIAVHLMWEAHQGPQSPRWPHLQLLPQEHHSTLMWSKEELQLLTGSNLSVLSTRLQEQAQADYDRLRQALFDKHPGVFPQESFSYPRYCWALASLWSRAMDFVSSQGQGQGQGAAAAAAGGSGPARLLRCIVPLLDLCNTAPGAPCSHVYDPSRKSLALVAQRDYGAGEEVVISYGDELPNHRLLRLYGFVIDDTGSATAPSSEVELFMSLSEGIVDMLPQRLALLRRMGCEPREGVPYRLTVSQPLPPALLAGLRVSRMTAMQVLEALQVPGPAFRPDLHPTDPKGEAEVLASLHHALADWLGAYPTTLEQDLQRLAAAGSGEVDLGYRERCALVLVVGEKRVLRVALAEVARRMLQLDGSTAATAGSSGKAATSRKAQGQQGLQKEVEALFAEVLGKEWRQLAEAAVATGSCSAGGSSEAAAVAGGRGAGQGGQQACSSTPSQNAAGAGAPLAASKSDAAEGQAASAVAPTQPAGSGSSGSVSQAAPATAPAAAAAGVAGGSGGPSHGPASFPLQEFGSDDDMDAID